MRGRHMIALSSAGRYPRAGGHNRTDVAPRHLRGSGLGRLFCTRLFGRHVGHRSAKHRIVDEKTRILLSVDDEQRYCSHESIAHVEHAVYRARLKGKPEFQLGLADEVDGQSY
jgi:hypothetical protein